ncbi:Os07g0481500 [Oryza sativa Japonica Group]|uniref:Os07g0481500 protein n=1 Tax=Oryza sativa subsp. japonica TaxID=39947 RepID=A0A0P0X5V7_ORYSJ|nr:Os07g0481500 [Oryza sativa Japonica Group]
MHDAALQALPMVLEWLKNKKLKTTADVDMQQLTSQRDNDNGSTPLHLAASMAGLPSLGSMSAGPSATRLLPDANVSTAYQPDNQGQYPIHAAASIGWQHGGREGPAREMPGLCYPARCERTNFPPCCR